MKKKVNNLTSFTDHLDEQYGKRGTKEREDKHWGVSSNFKGLYFYWYALKDWCFEFPTKLIPKVVVYADQDSTLGDFSSI